ncbi:MAG: hypothetical protein K0S46_1109 [Moraxellaceae bacterium]|jgi:hypothetical protein|nr:hypothetical protein [Moraxellaceae bacterium]
MDVNPYAAPQAVLKDPDCAVAAAAPFYVVAPRKLVLLMVMTVGIYSIYWFYRNWKQCRDATGEPMLPVLRGVFAIFFVHRLFRRVDAQLRDSAVAFAWQPMALATGYVVVALVSLVTDQLSKHDLATPYSHFALLPELAAHVFVLAQAQRAINAACADPGGLANRRITFANAFWLLAGAAWWAMVLFGLFIVATLPAPPA